MKRLIPLTLFAIDVASMCLLRWFRPTGMFLGPSPSRIGVVPIAVGLALGFPALYYLKKGRTTTAAFHEPRRLVTNGLYGYTRNPIYLGYALILAGTCIMLGASCLLVPPLIFVIVVDQWIIRAEERALFRKFGKEYDDYRSRTPRWI
jgi:protein-S-isoprenylcysteine O-methyltransferase Ste14